MNEQTTHLDLFSGIGGFALAARWAGYRTVAFSEIDPYCIRVLRKHWPDVPNLGDVRTADFSSYRGTHLLTGGFPCQPFSIAGRKLGSEDNRDLWPAMLGVIRLIRPDWVIGENVVNSINMVLARCLDDLAECGYKSKSFDIPACAVGLPSVERHVWIVAARDGVGIPGDNERNSKVRRSLHEWDNRCPAFAGNGRDLPKPHTLRSRKGISNWVDRIRGLGNAIPPYVAYQIMSAMRV